MSEIIQSITKIDYTINGALLEGGGQVLRNCSAYSALKNVSSHIENIRGGRSNPGLRPQHMTGINLISEIVNAKTTGVNVNSSVVTFLPNLSENWKLDKRSFFAANIGTAGSLTLLLQACLPVVLFRGVSTKLTLGGGTDVDFSPPMNYIIEVLFPILRKHCGIDIKSTIEKRGFYPKGGGIVHIDIAPQKNPLQPITLTNQGSQIKS